MSGQSLPKAQGYHIDFDPPHDSDLGSKRNRFGRWAFVVGAVLIVLAVSCILCGAIGTFFGDLPLGAAFGILPMLLFIRKLPAFHMIVIVEPWMGFYTQMPNGSIIIYGPGVHASYPWEDRDEESNQPLEAISREFVVDVQTTTARIQARGIYEYAMDLPNLDRAIGIDQSTIDDGLTAFIESFLTSRFSGQEAMEVLKKVREANEELADNFMRHDDGSSAELEAKYGFKTTAVLVRTFSLSEAAQRTRDAVDQAEMLHNVMARLYGETPENFAKLISEKKLSKEELDTLLNRAMATAKLADMKITVFEASSSITAAAGRLLEKLAK